MRCFTGLKNLLSCSLHTTGHSFFANNLEVANIFDQHTRVYSFLGGVKGGTRLVSGEFLVIHSKFCSEWPDEV